MSEDKKANLYDAIAGFLPVYYRDLYGIVNCTRWNGIDFRENQIKVLMALHILGNSSPSHLSDILYIQRGSLTTILRSLQGADIITKEFRTDDERSYLVSLTPRGKEFIREKTGEDRKKLGNLFRDLSEKEIDTVVKGFSTLVDYLERRNRNESQ